MQPALTSPRLRALVASLEAIQASDQAEARRLDEHIPTGAVTISEGTPGTSREAARVTKLSRLQRRILVQVGRTIRGWEARPETTGPDRIYDPTQGLLWRPAKILGRDLGRAWTASDRAATARAMSRLVARGLLVRAARRVRLTPSGRAVASFLQDKSPFRTESGTTDETVSETSPMGPPPLTVSGVA